MQFRNGGTRKPGRLNQIEMHRRVSFVLRSHLQPDLTWKNLPLSRFVTSMTMMESRTYFKKMVFNSFLADSSTILVTMFCRSDERGKQQFRSLPNYFEKLWQPSAAYRLVLSWMNVTGLGIRSIRWRQTKGWGHWCSVSTPTWLSSYHRPLNYSYA